MIEWSKREGEKVEPGDILASVETDKAVMDLEAFDEGILLAILAKPSSRLPVGTPVAIIGETGEEIDSLIKEAKAKLKELQSAPSNEEGEQEEPTGKEPAHGPETLIEEKQKTPAQPGNSAIPKIEETSDRIKASPLARKLASIWNVSLSSIKGSGPQGRIVKKDVEAAKERGGQVTLTSVIERQADKKVPISMMRQSIAKRLTGSKSMVPHFYLHRRLRLDTLSKLRSELNQDLKACQEEEARCSVDLPKKISVNDLIVRANALALREHPDVNAEWNEDSIILKGNIDIGIAVATEGGLIAPVLRNASEKNIFQISLEIRQLAQKARDRKLSVEEFTGSTFTISNLGMYDIDSFSAILNPPEAAIMAVGKATIEPYWDQEKQEFTPQEFLSVTLSCDHRVVDGTIGAEYLKTFAFFIEHPRLLI